ncbi:MAG: hypothetical protein H7Y27_11300 [Gemmatimonadaceae bacterium]|nr:hypothetical protein [Chitinophagaceae bacterium]
MKFGNWEVNNGKLEWTGSGHNRFAVKKEELLDTIAPDDDEEEMYKWILLAMEEEWLTDNDLYDMNFAFVFAAGQSGAEFDYEMFDNTMEYQFEVLNSEEEDEDENPKG